MPELPEVETVCLGMAAHLTNQRISKVEVRQYNLRKGCVVPQDFIAQINQRTIVKIYRRAKYILVALDNNGLVLCHLGMSGNIRIELFPDQYKDVKHDHIMIEFESGIRMLYNDPRRFGMFDYIPEAVGELLDPRLNIIGPEPLGNHFHSDYLYDKIHHAKASIKSLLLNQKIVAGLGNIYVAEALWDAGIFPTRLGYKLSRRQCDDLIIAIRKTLEAAIEAGGSSLRDYRQSDGELGYFQHQWRCYGREGEACSKDGCSGIIQRIIQQNRSTFYCAAHQR